MLEAKRHLVYQVNMFRLQEKTQMSMLVRRRERGEGGEWGVGKILVFMEKYVNYLKIQY